MEYEYPGIVRRYFSSVIDGLFVISAVVLASYALQSSDGITEKLRVFIILGMFFVYEPLCTSLFCTLGQGLTGIRVRKLFTLRRISIPAAYFRTIVRLFWGIISFFTIPLSTDRRAIHEFAVGSIVIYKKSFAQPRQPLERKILQ